MEKNMNIMVVGVGGQGTLLTSRIIGKTALSCGYDVKLSEVHGMAQRGGSVVTFVRFGENVYEPVVSEGKADVIISFEKLEAMRYAYYLKKGGVLVVNDCKIDPMTVVTGAAKYPENIVEDLSKKYNTYVLDGGKLAKELGNSKVLNTILLGYAAKFIGMEENEWLKTIEQTVPPKTIALNVEAFKLGYNQN